VKAHFVTWQGKVDISNVQITPRQQSSWRAERKLGLPETGPSNGTAPVTFRHPTSPYRSPWRYRLLLLLWCGPQPCFPFPPCLSGSTFMRNSISTAPLTFVRIFRHIGVNARAVAKTL